MSQLRMKELDGKTFYKISKSTPEIKNFCVESHYLEYPTNSLIVDEGKHRICYVPATKVISCIPYGDQLTEIIFDCNNPLFKKIENESVYYIGGSLEEYNSRSVVTGKNYSLSDPSTIQRIIDMTPTDNLHLLAALVDCEYAHPRITGHLKKLGFEESLKYWLSEMKKYKIY